MKGPMKLKGKQKKERAKQLLHLSSPKKKEQKIKNRETINKTIDGGEEEKCLYKPHFYSP